MPEVVRKKIPDLLGRTPRSYANWLLAGLEGYILDGRGRDAFPGAANYVAWEIAIEQDLARIYSVLVPHEASDFRLGVRLALGEAKPVAGRWGPVVSALFRLAALTGAAEVLDLPPALLNMASQLPDEERDEACRTMFEVAVELSVPTDAALSSLRLLIDSPGFRPAVASSALVALTRADPGSLASHLALLSDSLDARFHQRLLHEDDGFVLEERDELIATLAELAPLPALAKAFDPAIRRARGNSTAWALSDWFANGLVTSVDGRVETLLEKILTWLEKVPEPVLAPNASGLSSAWEDHREAEYALYGGYDLEPGSWQIEDDVDERIGELV